MSNTEWLAIKLRQMQQDINKRLEDLITVKYIASDLSFDIEQRIEDCIKAIDNLEGSINRLQRGP